MQILWLRQALAKLDLSDREILMLREFEQLSYAEIAELLTLPINTVRSRLFRARLTLKALLEADRTRVASAALAPREQQSVTVARNSDPPRTARPAIELRAEEEGLL